jgi:hypothetical protein
VKAKKFALTLRNMGGTHIPLFHHSVADTRGEDVCVVPKSRNCRIYGIVSQFVEYL